MGRMLTQHHSRCFKAPRPQVTILDTAQLLRRQVLKRSVWRRKPPLVHGAKEVHAGPAVGSRRQRPGRAGLPSLWGQMGLSSFPAKLFSLWAAFQERWGVLEEYPPLPPRKAASALRGSGL